MPRLLSVPVVALLALAAGPAAGVDAPPARAASGPLASAPATAAGAALASAAASAPAPAAATPPAIEGSWTVRARVVSARGGARPPAGSRRSAEYGARPCSAPCLVRLAERLPGGGHPVIAFSRSGRIYSGTARTRMRCAGGRVRARVTDRFQISSRVRRNGRRLAANLSGDAILRGTCNGAAARLVVRWTAVRNDLPEPPTPGFTTAPDPVSLKADGGLATFEDTSVDDLDGGEVVGWQWDFGDPASGASNVATGPRVTHTYTTVGTFTVTLTVTDDDGLRASVSDVISVEP